MGGIATTKQAEETTITMAVDKRCKGSVRYATADGKAPVKQVYVSRQAFETMPTAIQITVKAI